MNGAAAPKDNWLQKIAKLVNASWQLIGSIVGIVAIIGAGLTYFATREQLARLDCRMGNNLSLNTYPTQIGELTLEILLAGRDLASLRDAPEFANKQEQIVKKQDEIDVLKTQREQARKEYSEAQTRSNQGVCFEKAANSVNK